MDSKQGRGRPIVGSPKRGAGSSARTWSGVAVVLLGAAVVAYAWAFAVNVDEFEDVGTLGDAFGPLAGLASAVAVIMALRSVQLQSDALQVQRRELKLQRRELRLQRLEAREARKEMAAQRAQMERTAIAQEALAKSQAALATAQINANRRAAALQLAQQHGTIAALEAALAGIDSAIFQGRVAHKSIADIMERGEIGERGRKIRERLEDEENRSRQLAALIGKGDF